MSDPPLSLDGVGHAFGDRVVFEDVSLSVPAGTVTALLGPNGSGKTTLLRVAAGLLVPDRGAVERPSVDGRAVGYLPQSPAFRRGFTAAETLRFYVRLAGGDAAVERSLARVGLDGVGDRPVAALSGGMTRLLAVACATAGEPPLYVLDEPTSGLDPTAARRIFDVVGALAADGAGVLVATHDLRAAERAADDALLLDGGVVARGTPASLRREAGAETLAAAFETLVDGRPPGERP